MPKRDLQAKSPVVGKNIANAIASRLSHECRQPNIPRKAYSGRPKWHVAAAIPSIAIASDKQSVSKQDVPFTFPHRAGVAIPTENCVRTSIRTNAGCACCGRKTPLSAGRQSAWLTRWDRKIVVGLVIADEGAPGKRDVLWTFRSTSSFVTFVMWMA